MGQIRKLEFEIAQFSFQFTLPRLTGRNLLLRRPHGLFGGFGFVALVLASVNIFGGFLVTERMLAMYKKKG